MSRFDRIEQGEIERIAKKTAANVSGNANSIGGVPVNLPGILADGDVLTYSSSPTEWTAVSPADPPLIKFPAIKQLSNTYISSNVVSAASTSVSFTANRCFLTPIIFSRNTDINQLAVRVQTAVAGSLVQIALYNSNVDGWPTSSPITTSPNLDCSTTGDKTYTYTATLIGSTHYWLGMMSNGSSPNLRAWGVNALATLSVTTAGTVNNSIVYTPSLFGIHRNFTTSPVVAADLSSSSVPAIMVRAV